jgi:hypothetical protein
MQRVALQCWHVGAARKKADREAQAEADRLRQEEAEGLGWCDPFVKRMPPPHNPDVDVYVATDLLKYVYARLTRELAHLQYDMADYVAAGKLDREANDDLQGWCVAGIREPHSSSALHLGQALPPDRRPALRGAHESA